MNEEIFDQLKEIMVDELGIDGSEIKPESVLLSDLDINSLELKISLDPLTGIPNRL